jgi:hypothetical protein
VDDRAVAPVEGDSRDPGIGLQPVDDLGHLAEALRLLLWRHVTSAALITALLVPQENTLQALRQRCGQQCGPDLVASIGEAADQPVEHLSATRELLDNDMHSTGPEVIQGHVLPPSGVGLDELVGRYLAHRPLQRGQVRVEALQAVHLDPDRSPSAAKSSRSFHVIAVFPAPGWAIRTTTHGC